MKQKTRNSAQDTIPRQAFSTAFFALSMTKNACRERLGVMSLSALLFPLESNNTEPSQPYEKKNKWETWEITQVRLHS